MLKQYDAICKFIVAEQSVLGAGCDYCTSTAASQVDSLRKIFATGQLDVSIAGSLLERLNEHTPAFDAAQRRALAEVVSTSMRASRPSDAVASDTKGQIHPYMYNYLTAADWHTIRDLNSSFSCCMLCVISACFRCGCRRMRETNITVNVSIIAAARGVTLSADDHYSKVQEFKSMIQSKRIVSPGLNLLASYPCDVAEFLSMHPSCYTADAQPIECPIDVTIIRAASLRQPTRSSNKSIRAQHIGRRKIDTPNGNGDIATAALEYILNGRGNSAAARPPIIPYAEAPRPPLLNSPPNSDRVSGSPDQSANIPAKEEQSPHTPTRGTAMIDPSSHMPSPTPDSNRESVDDFSHSHCASAIAPDTRHAHLSSIVATPTAATPRKLPGSLVHAMAAKANPPANAVVPRDAAHASITELEGMVVNAVERMKTKRQTEQPSDELKAKRVKTAALVRCRLFAKGPASGFLALPYHAPVVDGAVAPAVCADAPAVGAAARRVKMKRPCAPVPSRVHPSGRAPGSSHVHPSDRAPGAPHAHASDPLPFPPMSTRPTYYHGGRIYCSNRGGRVLFRVYLREADKVATVQKIMPPRDAAAYASAFRSACQQILDDPRDP